MTDSVAEEVIAEAFRKLGSHYVLGAEGPTVFDCSGLMDWIFNETGHGALVGTTRKLAAGYARYFADNGKFSRNFSDAQRGDLICYSHNGTHVSHIGIYLGNGDAISALIEPYHVSKHVWSHIGVPFYGVCLVDYPSDTSRTGPDDTDSQDDDPEFDATWAPSAPRAVQILFDGDDITANVRFADARFVGYAGGQPGEVQIRVRDKEHAYAPGYFHAGGTLELWIDGRREWDGWVMVVGREWAFDVDNTETPLETPRYWVLEGWDRNLLFNKRFHYDLANPTNFFIGDYPAMVSDQFVVLDVLANYTELANDGLDIVSGITEVGPIDPYEKINVLETGMPWGEFMRKICLYNGAVFYIDPDRIVQYVDDTTMTAPFGLSDEPGPSEVGYREATIFFSANAMANEAFIWGVGVGSDDPAFARVINEDAIAMHGLFQYGETVQGMYLNQSVERRADVLVNGSPTHARGHKEDVIRVECTIFTPGLRVGMGVSFRAGAWDFGDLFYEGTDTVYTPGNYDKNTEFERLLFQIGKIESHNNYTSQNHRSFAYGRWQVMPGNWRVWGPIALGYPRSMGVAARNIDPDDWFPPPTPENQDRVVRWRMGKLYNNKGHDPRRVAASWRSGASVGARDPSEWSRGTLLYVNHACMPLGYPETTNASVLDPISAPDVERDDYQEPVNVDDVIPVRKIEMTFPTPTSVKYALMLSHSYDEAWAWKDPFPTGGDDPEPTGDWYSEIILLNGYPGIFGEPQPDDDLIGDTFLLNGSGNASEGVHGHNTFSAPNLIWIQDGPYSLAGLGAGSIHSAVGRGQGLQNVLEPTLGNPCGDDAWTNWENSENWFGPVSASLAAANERHVLELSIDNGAKLVMGYVPSVLLGVSLHPPTEVGYGGATAIGSLANLSSPDDIAYRPDWATAYGVPVMEVQFDSITIPAGTLEEGMWLSLSPGWQCEQRLWPALYCDTGAVAYWGTDPVAAACNNRGPECTGVGKSGRCFSGFNRIRMTVLATSQGSGWVAVPAAGTQNSPATYWSGGQYRTLYPYASNTLSVTWQGVTLTKGVEVIEVDPSRGIFELVGVGSGEMSITVRYYVPANSEPTDPLPGEPPGAHEPVPGPTSGGNAVEAVIRQAYSFLGVPYDLGSESRQQTDCSGLIFQIFRDAGYGYLVGTNRKLAAGYTRYFSAQGNFSRSLTSAQRGDLISYSANGSHVSHIGIYLGGGMAISACHPKVIKHRVILASVGFYGVCMVPYDRARTGNDSYDDPDDTETPQPTPDDPPPQEEPDTTAGRIYRPRSQCQLGWGTQYDGNNNIAAASAMLLDRHTLGAHNDLVGAPLSTPPEHREQSGKSGVLTLDDVEAMWDNGWNEELVTFDLPLPWGTFKSEIQNRGAIVLGLNSALPAALRKSNASGPYALYVNEQLPDGSFWVSDPIARGGFLMPEAALLAFTRAIADDDIVTCVVSRRTPTL